MKEEENKDMPEKLVGTVVITKNEGGTYTCRGEEGDEMFTAPDRLSAMGVAACCISAINLLPASVSAPFVVTHIEWVE